MYTSRFECVILRIKPGLPGAFSRAGARQRAPGEHKPPGGPSLVCASAHACRAPAFVHHMLPLGLHQQMNRITCVSRDIVVYLCPCVQSLTHCRSRVGRFSTLLRMTWHRFLHLTLRSGRGGWVAVCIGAQDEGWGAANAERPRQDATTSMRSAFPSAVARDVRRGRPASALASLSSTCGMQLE